MRRRAIYDGPTYLYTRWTIRVRGKFNPAATSYDAFNGNPATPVPQPGNNPAWTDNSVRLMLLAPRGGLWYTADGPDAFGNPIAFPGIDLTILSIPPPVQQLNTVVPQIVDANFGPFPLECSVRSIDGNRTFTVDFTLQADVNECYRVYAQPAFVLSNRWEMTHDINEHGFTIRHVRGRAIFRTDVVLQQNIRLDDYRSNFTFPCPTNFKRQNVRVRLNAAGNELHYGLTDVEQSHNIIAKNNVTKIEAWASVDQSQESGAKFVSGAVSGAAKGFVKGGAVGAGTGAAIGSVIPGVGTAAGAAVGGLVGAGVGGIAGGASGGARALPHSVVSVVARVWGNRNATRSQLMSVASNIILAKIPQLAGASALLYGVGLHAGFDLVGRFVEFAATLKAGPFMTVFGSTSFNDLADPGNVQSPLMIDNIPNVAVTDDTPGYSLPNGNGMRGSYLESCVAQALQNICGDPPTSTLVTFATDGNLLTVPPSSTPTVPTESDGTTSTLNTVPGQGTNYLSTFPSGTGANTGDLPSGF